jgi:Leucine-rich repeat (LRR) protein
MAATVGSTETTDPLVVARSHTVAQAAESVGAAGLALDLSFGGLTGVPAPLPRAAAVVHLNLSDNKLTHWPAAVCRRLPSLRVLLLRYNRLVSLPPDLGRLRCSH